MKCYHHNDADGRCAAAVVHLAMLVMYAILRNSGNGRCA